MKVNLYIGISLLLLSFAILMAGCSEQKQEQVETGEKTEGYILKIEGNRILVAEGVSSDEYKKIKDKTIEELTKENIRLIYLSYDKTINFKKGNKIEVWIEGGIDQSNPAQAKAKKIVIKE